MHDDPRPPAASIGPGPEEEHAQRLYGADWEQDLQALCAALTERLNAIAGQSLAQLEAIPSSGRLIRTMAASEREQFKAGQTAGLLMLTAPDLDAARHRESALARGYRHALMGVSHEDLVFGHEIVLAIVRGHVDIARHAQALTLLGQRMMRDIALQMLSYQRVQVMRHELTQDITRLVWEVTSRTDLISRVTERLARYPEIASSAFGSLDAQGTFRFEAAAGHVIDGYLAALERKFADQISESAERSSRGPTSRAWRSRRVQRSINIETDPTMTPWRNILLRQGFRSFVSVPIGPPDSPPSLILNLYSVYPGGFSSTYQQAFIEHLRTLLRFALARIESRFGHVYAVPYTVRQRWTALLRSPALEMHYQPLLELRTGQITKAEALVRLRDGGKLLTPDEFFPSLQSEDFFEIYDQGLLQVLRQSAQWRRHGLNLTISINLPASALTDERYLNVTRQALHDHGCAPSTLTLELLETGTEPGVDIASAVHRFKALGVQLAEDDLGIGYSGLARLREIPFDLVKIDRSIIRNAERDASDVLRFIYQLTRLGHSLGKLVAIEGVENAALLEAAMIFDTDFIQGYAIARPMPAPVLQDWISGYRPPTSADRQIPRSAIAKLARLLVWEEHLHLMLNGSTAGSPPPVLPLEVAVPEMQQTLVDAAVNHRMTSDAYRLARQRLIDAINGS